MQAQAARAGLTAARQPDPAATRATTEHVCCCSTAQVLAAGEGARRCTPMPTGAKPATDVARTTRPAAEIFTRIIPRVLPPPRPLCPPPRVQQITRRLDLPSGNDAFGWNLQCYATRQSWDLGVGETA